MNEKYNYYIVYCENEFTFISFIPLTDIYCDCNVYGIEYDNCTILNIVYHKNENEFIQWLHENNIKYECEYYGM